MKNRLKISSGLMMICVVISCKSTDKVANVNSSEKDETLETPVLEKSKQVEPTNNFEIKMDKGVPVQSISIDTNRVKGFNMSRPK